MKLYGGLYKVSYSSDSINWADIDGPIAIDSVVSEGNTISKTSNTYIYAGEFLACEIYFYSHRKYAILQSMMLNNQELYWRLYFSGSATIQTKSPCPFFITNKANPSRRAGVTAFRLNFEFYKESAITKFNGIGFMSVGGTFTVS